MRTLKSTPDTVTILRVLPGRMATKKIVADKNSGLPSVTSYDAGNTFLAHPLFPVSSIETLSKLLKTLETEPECFVIRGEPVDQRVYGIQVRRTGSGFGNAFKGNFRSPELGHSYLMLDFDKIKLPTGLVLSPATVRQVVEYVIKQLPKEFHDVTCHWQLSSSAGFVAPDVVSLHLWFWLARPIPDQELKRWGKFVNERAGFKLIDTALFQHVQVHYTAAPIFENVANPFALRSGLRKKKSGSVDLQLPPSKSATERQAVATIQHTLNQSGYGFEHHLARIGDHPGGDGFHEPLRDAAASYVATVGAEGVDVEWLYKLLRDATIRADHSKHTDEEIDQRTSRDHIMPLIQSAIAKFGKVKPQPRTKSKLYENVPPHFPTSYKSKEAIAAELNSMLTHNGSAQSGYRC